MAVDDLLIRVRSDVAAARSGLQSVAATTGQLNAATVSLGAGMGRTGGFALDLGRALNDSQQFAYGFRSGLVAVSNQVDGLIFGLRAISEQAKATGTSFGRVLVGSLTGTGGLLIALNLAISAAAIFGPAIADAFGQSEAAADAAGESYREALADLIRFEHESRKFQELTLAQARAGYTNARAARDQLQAQRDLIAAQREAARPTAGGGGQLTGRGGGDAEEFARLGTELNLLDARIARTTDRIGEYAEAIRDAGEQAQILADVGGDIGEAVLEEEKGSRRAARAARERARAIRDVRVEALALGAVQMVPGGFAAFTDPNAITQLERQALVLAAIQDQIRGTGEVLVEAQRPFNEFAATMSIAFTQGVAEGAIAFTEDLADAFAGVISLQDSFQTFAGNVVASIQQIVAAMVRAVAQALIMRGVLAALNLIPGFGGSGIGGIIRGALGGGDIATGGGGLASLAVLPSGRARVGAGVIELPFEVVAGAFAAAQAQSARTGARGR